MTSPSVFRRETMGEHTEIQQQGLREAILEEDHMEIQYTEEEEDLKQSTATVQEIAEMIKTPDDSEGKMDNDQSKCDGAAAVGGYNQEKPPADDCCPICFDEFHFPCRTSCGHWFCTNCILELWRYSTSAEPCKCPMCSCLIAKLVPDSSLLIQSGEEVGKILEKIKQYNRVCGGGLAGFLLKTLAFPMLVRRRAREYLSPLILRNIYNITRLAGILLSLLYDSYNFHFFPNGVLGIQLLFEICGYALVLLLILDALWYHWTVRQRVRNLVQDAHLQ